MEEPPINATELNEMIADFINLFKMDRQESSRRCDQLYLRLKENDFLGSEHKFSLSAEKLEKAIVLENILSMEEARQPMFAKKPTAGNSNTEMSRWKKKEKGKDKEKEKAFANFNRHLKEI